MALTYLPAAGTYDWVCNWIGNYAWVSTLEWSGHSAFAAEELRAWEVDGKPVGESKSTNGLTWATVYGAGHMVRPTLFLIAEHFLDYD